MSIRETHKTVVPAEKYLPSLGNAVSLDLAISSVARIAATDIQTELKAMWRPGQTLNHKRKSRISFERQYYGACIRRTVVRSQRQYREDL